MGWDVAGVVGGERQSGQRVDDVAFPARPSPSSCPQSVSQPAPLREQRCQAICSEQTKDLSRNNFLTHAFTCHEPSSGHHILSAHRDNISGASPT